MGGSGSSVGPRSQGTYFEQGYLFFSQPKAAGHCLVLLDLVQVLESSNKAQPVKSVSRHYPAPEVGAEEGAVWEGWRGGVSGRF